MSKIYFVGVDVGTGSSRAALVNSHGQVIKSYVKEIKTWNPQPDHYEQSSDDIWKAVCECVKVCLIYCLVGIPVMDNLRYSIQIERD